MEYINCRYIECIGQSPGISHKQKENNVNNTISEKNELFLKFIALLILFLFLCKHQQLHIVHHLVEEHKAIGLKK